MGWCAEWPSVSVLGFDINELDGHCCKHVTTERTNELDGPATTSGRLDILTSSHYGRTMLAKDSGGSEQ